MQLIITTNDGLKFLDARPLNQDVRDEREALGLIHWLFHKPLLKAEVIAGIQNERTISEAVRRKALELVQLYRDEPGLFQEASWNFARRPDLSPEQYQKAVGYAETSCRLDPDDATYLATLGLALSRAGRYAEAKDTLVRAAGLISPSESKLVALASLAMTLHQLAETDESRRVLDQLRELQKQVPEPHADHLSLVREAESLLAAPDSPRPPG